MIVKARIKKIPGDYRSDAFCGRCGRYLWGIEGSPIAHPARLEAKAGDRSALRRLREVLDAAPELWLEAGNLGRQAGLALVRVAAGDNPVAKEAFVRKLDTLRREVAGPSPSTLEQLLADRVAIGWLALTLAEGTYHQSLEGRIDPATEAAYLKRVDRAHRGYLAPIKTLAQVRKLGVPALQVNIGEKQVNLSGG